MIPATERSRHLAWYHANKRTSPGRHTAARWRANFGISVTWYLAQWHHQAGRCAACGGVETALDTSGQRIKLLAVDHDHSTGEVRELLCQRCNIMVANSADNLRRGATYLERHA